MRKAEGFNIAMQTLDQARTWMGCVATGIAQRGINEAVAYGKERDPVRQTDHQEPGTDSSR